MVSEMFAGYRISRFQRPLLVLLCSALLLPSLLTAQDSKAKLTSPRVAFETFLVAMINYSKEADDALREGYIQTAVQCLNLSEVPRNLRSEAGPKLARDLKMFLDRFEIVIIENIPDSPEGNNFVWRKPAADAEISLLKNENGEWLFSPRTLESLPVLLDMVKGQDIVEGVEAAVEAETLADWLREKLPESLTERIILLENWQWLGLLVLILLGLIVERLFTFLLSSWIYRLTQKSKSKTRYKVPKNLIRPVGIFFMAYLWYLTIGVLDLPVQSLEILYVAIRFILVASAVWALYRVVDIGSDYLAAQAARTETKFDDIMVPMLRRALKIIVIAFGLLFIADNLDVNITSLLAGLGIGGIALALAAKDTVENLFGSLTVLIDQPFQIGDWIKIGELEGTVEDVGFRSTRIRTFHNSLISMPNGRLVNSPVDNYGKREFRRISTKLGVQYDTPPEKIDAFCEGIREIIRQHPYTRKDFYLVYFTEFAGSSLNILLYVFHKTPDWATELRERHRLFVDIVRLAHRLGVEFAFPTQTLHIASVASPEIPTGDAGTPPGDVSGKEINSVEEAFLLGRNEARKIVREIWSEEKQIPVSFSDPGTLQAGIESKSEQ